jgi:hypothetical protein
MKLTANMAEGRLSAGTAVYPIGNRIRTIRDGTRGASEVVRCIPDNLPYDPLPFPKGVWRITGLDWQMACGFDPRTYGPVKIRTDAWQWVTVWELDADGDYLRDTERRVKDTCYWLHYSVFSSTLGCIRLASPQDATAIATILAAMREGPVELEVV